MQQRHLALCVITIATALSCGAPKPELPDIGGVWACKMEPDGSGVGVFELQVVLADDGALSVESSVSFPAVELTGRSECTGVMRETNATLACDGWAEGPGTSPDRHPYSAELHAAGDGSGLWMERGGTETVRTLCVRP